MATPQRLPIVNSDDGVWGDIIRQYLAKEHYNDDTDNAVNGGHQKITIRAGTATAGTAPLKFTSGTLLTTPEAGAVEFNTDTLYFTQTTSTTRKTIAAYDDTSGATGDIYYRNSGGYFTRLGIGGTGTVLTVSSGIPSWSSSLTNVTLTTPVINGTPTGTGVATAATASTLALRDSNANISANNVFESSTTTATSAITTTLTIASTQIQIFTGTTTQTVKLPTTSVPQGAQYLIVNQSTGAVTVQSSGANTITTLAANTSAVFTALIATPVAATDWQSSYGGVSVNSGKTLTVNNSLVLAGTDGTVLTFPSTNATIARTDAAQTFTGVQTLSSSPVLSSGAVTVSGNTITFPATADTLVGRATTDTFTGAKTFNSGKFILAGSTSGTTIVNATAAASGTLTLPAATDTLVGKATTDTFTNKTYDTAGTGNVFKINGTQVSAVTGTGSAVLATSPTLTTPNLGTPSTLTLTNATGLPLTGLASSAYNTTPTASTLAEWDANKNLSANAYTNGFTTTVTSAGIKILSITDTGIQVFTGTTTHTVKLPTTSVAAGAQYTIINQSTGAVTVQSSGANTISTLAGGTSGIFTAVSAAPTTAAGWASQVITNSSGTVTATAGSLTANSVVLGAGTTDTKVVAGIVTDGTSKLTLGVAGTSVGSVSFNNATSGAINLAPTTGALGTSNLVLPAASDTLVGRATVDTLTNKTLTDPKINNIKDTNGTTVLNIGTATSAVNYVQLYNAIATQNPTFYAAGSDTNVGFNFVTKGNGSFTVYDYNFGLQFLVNSGTPGSNVNYPYVTPSTTGNGVYFGAWGTDTNVDLNLSPKGSGNVKINGSRVTTIADVANKADVNNNSSGALLTGSNSNGSTIDTHPESSSFVNMPHMFNDIAYNNVRGGSVIWKKNGSAVSFSGSDNPFAPDVTFASGFGLTSTSDVITAEVTTWKTFNWGTTWGIVMTPWISAKNVTIEVWDNIAGSWNTAYTGTNNTTGYHWISWSAPSGHDMTKVRYTLTNFTQTNDVRITSLFAIEYDSPLLSGTFLPKGGGTMYGALNMNSNTIQNATISSPKMNAALDPTYGVNSLIFTAAGASAVNYLIANSNTSGNGAQLIASGSDTNVSMELVTKGTGVVKANGIEVATISGTQTLTSKTLSAPVISGTITGTYTIGGTPTFPSTVVITTSAQVLTNKDLTSGTNTFPTFNQSTTGNAATATALQNSRTIQTNLASTTSASFNGTANITPGVTGTLPVGNGGTGVTTLTGVVIGNGTSAFTTVTAPSGTIVGTTDAQVLTNKTVTDSSFTVQDNGDTSKKFQFDGSAITTATTRTYTMPNATTSIPGKYTTSIGNGSSTAITVTHNLNTQDVIWSLRDATTNEFVDADVVSTSTTQITFTFATAPATNAYKVVIIG